MCVLGELTAVAADVKRLAREPGAMAHTAGLGGYMHDYLPLLLEHTQPVSGTDCAGR